MILAKEFGIPILEMPLIRHRMPSKKTIFGLDSRAGSRSGQIRFSNGTDIWKRVNGADELALSQESEHDLALMVSDFLENGSSGTDSRPSSDSDGGLSDLGRLAEKISLYKRAMDQQERDLLSVIQSLLLSIEESDLRNFRKTQCSLTCVRQILVKLLKLSGYDAAICVAKWQGLDKVPGGDHEYIDVILGENSERLIVDIDFKSHFEIARAVKSYDSILNSLPAVYVGNLPRLKQFLQVMADAAKYSLKLNAMPLPPWRSLSYLQAKWNSKYERKEKENEKEIGNNGFEGFVEVHEQCVGHLRRVKLSLQSEAEMERIIGKKKEKKWRGLNRRGSVLM